MKRLLFALCALTSVAACDQAADAPPPEPAPPKRAPLPELRGDVEFRDVSFEYNPGTPVLQHVPVRSVDQITAKSLIGARRLSIKVGRSKTQTAHWDHMAEKIRAANYRLPHSEMLAMAFLYAGDLSQACDHTAIDETAPRVGTPDDQILFADLSRINILMKFDQFAARRRDVVSHATHPRGDNGHRARHCFEHDIG